MTDRLDPWDRALLAALDSPPPQGLLTLQELAGAAEVSPALVEVVVREGFLTPRAHEPELMFDPADVRPVKAGLALVTAGLPLGELLDLARRTDEALRPIAEQAVEVFSRFIRDAVEATSSSAEEASTRLVAAVQSMLPATGHLVEHYFRQLLAEGARRRLGQ
ncbi:MAG TPA: hypothetical protein VJR05_13025 [Acidimicrobiia bacterium]|nr:hypothetical protein [Acidimicrobiia bacterium]